MLLNCDCGNRTTLNADQAATLAQLRQPFTCPQCGKVRPLPPWAGTGGSSRVVTVLGLLVLGLVIAAASGTAGFVTRGSLASQGVQVQLPALPAGFAPVAAMVGGTPEQKLVREYLKQKTETGTWEEVKWWPPVKDVDGHEVVRLRFRSKNRFGAMMLFDFDFTIQNGIVTDRHGVDGRPD